MRQIEELTATMHVAEVIVLFEESVLGVYHLHAGQRFCVGQAPDAELFWPGVDARLHALVRVSPSGVVELCASPAITTSIELLDSEIGGGKLSFARELDTSAEIATLPEHARARIAFGEVSLLVGRTEAPRRRSMPPRIDFRAHVTTAATAIFFALFLMAVNAIPPSGQTLVIDPFAMGERIARVELTPPVTPPGGGAPPGQSPASSPSGRPRTHSSPPALATPNTTTIARSAPTLSEKRGLAQAAAAQAGILGVLQTLEGSNTGSVFGAATALSGDASAVLGSLDGHFSEGGLGNGSGGLVGSGRGGGAGGEGTVGLGGLGGIGRGGGAGSGAGYSRGIGGLGGRTAHAPETLTISDPIVHGIDRELIRRVVRQHLNEVKFCYEKELSRKPDLDGRVVTSFVISNLGTVASATISLSTLHDAAVEGCIANAIRRWEFPKPSGPALVSYPFAFHAAQAAVQ